jgi:hypothetical protein
MKKVKFVDLVFENCEVARLTPKMFRGLGVYQVSKSYDVNCAQYEAGEMSEYFHCERFTIIINKKGLDEAELMPDFSALKDSPQNLRERLKRWKDITHVDLVFSEKRTKKNLIIKRDSIYISVPWPEEEQFTNHYQKHTWWQKDNNDWLDEGEMRIEIEEPKT